MALCLEGIEIYAGGFVLFLITLRNISEWKRSTSSKAVPFSVMLSTTMLVLLMPVLIAILCVLALYRQVVRLVLTIKHGSKFGGLVKGADTFHIMENPSTSLIHLLVMIQCTKKRSSEDFFDSVREIVWKTFSNSKFKMIFLKAFGYFYMLKAQLTMDDCIKTMKVIKSKEKSIDRAELLELVNDCANAPLGNNKTLSWEVLVGTQLVNWKEDEFDYYPLLFRIHHAVTDGVTLFKLLMVDSVADKEDVQIVSLETWKKTVEISPSLGTNRETLKILAEYFINITINLYKHLVMGFYAVLLAPASLIANFISKAKDCNILQGPPLTRKKLLAFSIEESQEYFEKTKRIKNKIPGTTFPDVLLTAFAASLMDYFKKHSPCAPEYITTVIPIVPGSSEICRLIPGKFNVNCINVENNYCALLMKLPIAQKNEDKENNSSLINRLKLIKKESVILRNSVDYQVSYFFMNIICAVLPHSAIKLLINRMHYTTSLSILAGPAKLTYDGRSMVLLDVVGWVPHLYTMGVTLSIITYDSRLHLGFSADKALISDTAGAQSILDRIYNYLDLLEEEVDSIYKKNN